MHRHAVEREKTFLHAVGLTCVLVCAQEHRRDDFGRIPGCPGPLEILQCRVETPESKSNAMWKTKIHDSTVLIENSHQIPGVPSYTTGIQEYPVCQPESRIHPSRIQEYPSTASVSPISRPRVQLPAQSAPRLRRNPPPAARTAGKTHRCLNGGRVP